MSRRSRKAVAPAQPGPPEAQGLTAQVTNRVLSFNRRRYPRKETLESVISSALRLEDNELDKILGTLEELSKIAKSQQFDAVAMDDARKLRNAITPNSL